MVNRALVFSKFGDLSETEEWKEYELRKANWFIDSLMMWGWTRSNIIFLAPDNPEINSHQIDGAPDKTTLEDEMNSLKNTQDSEYIAVYISDNMPCSGENDSNGDPLQPGIFFDATKPARDPANISSDELKDMITDIQRGDEQDRLCVILSGKGVDGTGPQISSSQYITMVSHDSTFGDMTKKDLFDIAGKMPLVQPNDLQQAFVLEKNRVMDLESDPQYPLMLLE